MGSIFSATPTPLTTGKAVSVNVNHLRTLLFESELFCPSIQRLFISPRLVTPVIIEGDFTFIKTGMALEIIRQDMLRGSSGPRDFYKRMRYEFGLAVEEVDDAITCSQIARRVLMRNPQLGLRELVVRHALPVANKHNNSDRGVREAADLLLDLASKHDGELTTKTVSQAVGEWLHAHAL